MCNTHTFADECFPLHVLLLEFKHPPINVEDAVSIVHIHVLVYSNLKCKSTGAGHIVQMLLLEKRSFYSTLQTELLVCTSAPRIRPSSLYKCRATAFYAALLLYIMYMWHFYFTCGASITLQTGFYFGS